MLLIEIEIAITYLNILDIQNIKLINSNLLLIET